MQAIVSPSSIKGMVTAPTSKSAMQRACAAALIRHGKTILHNPGSSADDKAALTIIQQLGATVEAKEDQIVIESKGVQPVTDEINCGESGLSVRMFTSIAATAERLIKISGSGSLRKRPLNFFNEVLPLLNVQITSKDGYLPLSVKGPMKVQDITVDGSLSSQYLTGLLFAYAAAYAHKASIKVTNLNSKPYIDLTLNVMKAFGLKTPVNRNYTEFYFDEVIHKPTGQAINFTIESDWSGAAFLLVAGAIAGAIEVKGLDVSSAQADKAILEPLRQSGAIMNIEEKQISVQPAPLKAFNFNATDCPDLFPPLVVLAAYCTGTSVIEGVHRLTHKESNRALTLQEEFGKMNVAITLQDDSMLIKGTEAVSGATVHSRHDHRIAMACAVAALKADEACTIDAAEAVNKSYPQFWQHLQKLGAAVSLSNQ